MGGSERGDFVETRLTVDYERVRRSERSERAGEDRASLTVCEHCADGCAQRTDHRSVVVTRRLAADDPEVNDEWNCDKGRFGFTYTSVGDRITRPMVRLSSLPSRR